MQMTTAVEPPEIRRKHAWSTCESVCKGKLSSAGNNFSSCERSYKTVTHNTRVRKASKWWHTYHLCSKDTLFTEEYAIVPLGATVRIKGVGHLLLRSILVSFPDWHVWERDWIPSSFPFSRSAPCWSRTGQSQVTCVWEPSHTTS